MQQEEIYYTIALTRLMGLNQTISQRLYETMGSGKAVYEHRQDIGDVLQRWSLSRRKEFVCLR